jgi:hypothetical protein
VDRYANLVAHVSPVELEQVRNIALGKLNRGLIQTELVNSFAPFDY